MKYRTCRVPGTDWRNRNRIKTPLGSAWLSIPVSTKGRYDAPINTIEISEPGWASRHWKTFTLNYARAPFFRQYEPELESLFRDAVHDRLSTVNHTFIAGLCRMPPWSFLLFRSSAATEAL